MTIDLDGLSLDELLELQGDLATAVRRRVTALTNPTDELHEVIRVGLRRYRAVVQTVAPRAKRDTFLREYRRCVLGISLGSPHSEGAKFEAAVRWVAENFDECRLGIGDGIYRWTLQVTAGRDGRGPQDLTPDDWHARALEAGRKFRRHAERIVAPYRDQCRFTWSPMSDVQAGDGYADDLAAFRALYDQGGEYRDLVHDFASLYLSRMVEREGASSSDAFEHESACNYLLEECAIFSQLCREGWEVLVYPGSIRTFSAIAEGQVPGVPEPITRFVHVALHLKRGNLFFAESEEFGYAAMPDHDHAEAAADDDGVVPGVLCDFGEGEWQRFLAYTTRRRLLPGDILAPAGDHDRSLYVLLDGELEVLDGDLDAGRLRQVATHHPGSVLGEQNFVNGRPRATTLAALGESEVLVLSQKQLAKMREREPALAAALLFDISREMALKG